MTTTLGDSRRRQTMTGPSKTALCSHRLLVGLELFTGVAAVIGGLLLMMAPDGSLLAADPAVLHGSPFADWRVPGLLLGTLVGAGYLLAGTWQWRDGTGARALSMLAGCGLVAFETAELRWIGFQPLEVVFAVVGVTVVGLAVFVGRRPQRRRIEGGVMRAVVVYESMYGNTHLIADAIGNGLRPACQVEVIPVGQADRHLLDSADLVVVGGPTHAHGMSRANTRQAAVAGARKPDSGLALEPDAEGPGLREWFDSSPALHGNGAAFDTRVNLPVLLTGQAARGIARRLRRGGLELVAEPHSFLVTKQNRLEPGEAARAREWGRQLAETMAASGDRAGRPA